MIMISKRFQVNLPVEFLSNFTVESLRVGARVLPYIFDLQEAEEHPKLDDNKGMAVAGKITTKPLEEILVEDGPLGYTSKQATKDVPLAKVTITSTPNLEDFKHVILNKMGTPPLPKVNIELVMEDLLDTVSEKEEKEVN